VFFSAIWETLVYLAVATWQEPWRALFRVHGGFPSYKLKDMSEEQKQCETTGDLFISAIDLWCDQYHPSSSDENTQMMSMQEILEALDSLYVTDSFSGSVVFEK